MLHLLPGGTPGSFAQHNTTKPCVLSLHPTRPLHADPLLHVCLLRVLQASRRAEAAEARADAASRELRELGAKLAAAEDDVLALEGQVNILEQELATVAPR